MKIFITYYLISGLIMAYYTQKRYDNGVKQFPILEIFGKEVIIILQFFIGFVALPMWIYSKIKKQFRK